MFLDKRRPLWSNDPRNQALFKKDSFNKRDGLTCIKTRSPLLASN